MNKKILVLLAAVVVLVQFLNLAIAVDYYPFSGERSGSVSSVSSEFRARTGADITKYYSGERLTTYYPVLSDNAEMCKARQDILLLQVPPAGCQPTVVRSDLLAEQNVPVFCQLSALKINPLIDVKQIKNIRFTGTYPKGIAGVGFHPAKAALRTGDALLGSPLVNNIGYAVVVLNRNENESSMPAFINLTLQASLEYDAEYALGIGKASFIVKPVTDDEWKSERNRQSFLKGQFYLRAEEITPAYAILSIYQGDKRINVQKVERGKDSNEIFLPGYYCQVAVRLAYDGYFGGGDVARLQVDDDEFDVYVGSRFLNDKCSVEKIESGELEVKEEGTKTATGTAESKGYSLERELSYASGSRVKILKDGKDTGLYVVYGKKIITGIGSVEDSFFVASFDENGNRKEVIADAERVIGTTNHVKITNINSVNVPKEYSDFVILNNQIISVAKSSEGAKGTAETKAEAGVSGGVKNITIRCGSERFVLGIKAKSINVGDIVKKINNGAINEEYEVTNIESNGKYTIKKFGDTSAKEETGIVAKNLVPVSPKKLFEVEYDKGIEKAFKEAIDNYEKVADEYPLEKDNSELQKNTGIPPYGQQALENAIKLSKDMNKEITEAELIDKYLKVYASGTRANEFRRRLNEMYTKDTSLAGQTIEIDNAFRVMRLIDVYGKSEKANAEFLVNPKEAKENNGKKENVVVPVVANLKGSRVEVKYGNNLSVTGLKYIGLEDIIDVDAVKARVYCEEVSNSGEKSMKDEIVYIKLDESIEVCSKKVVLKLTKIEPMNSGQVRIIPVSKKTESNTNVTIGVGIEKRAIKLSPEKIKDMIDNINKSIDRWDSLNKKLGEVVKGLKGACFATAGVLTVKNFFSGLSGESLAREKVMRGEGGWTEKCQQMVANKNDDKDYDTLMQCYNGESVNIKKDVEAYKKAISNTNSKIEELEKDCTIKNKEGLFSSGKIVDREKCAGKIIYEINRKYKDKRIVDSNKDGKIDDKDITVEELLDEKKNAGYEELRDLYMNLEVMQDNSLSKDNVGKTMAGSWAGRIGASINERKNAESAIESIQEKLDGSGLEKYPIDTYIRKDAIIGEYYGGEISSGGFGLIGNNIFPGSKPRAAKIVPTDNGVYLFLLQKVNDGSYIVDPELNGESKAIYKLKTENGKYVANIKENKGVSSGEFSKTTGIALSAFNKVDRQSYRNKYTNYEVRYFESEPYKGMPALVPLDIDEGWYVATKQTLPTLGNIKSFDSSGRPASFWLCNVGSDEREDFYMSGRDICRQFNLNTGQALEFFPGLAKDKTKKLVDKAVYYLEEAARQYGNGRREVVIEGKRFPVGNPAVNVPKQQCQDFMSPGDCKLMFNVCDPVICPASRCDLGGNFPVSDVIQTGIIGGLVMCLPNWNDGVYMPFCLSGIHAGIEAYVTILKSHSKCLQEQLNSGKVTGICDQITAFYTCKLFWDQLAPVANIIIPKMIDKMYYGTRLKGGGEYLTTMDAWENMQASVKYFTQSYGVNTFEAFRVRSVAEAGGTFCKAFVSMKAPKAIDVLLEPDSPPQFHAWFSTTKFSDATVPATAQYKVFYHISAGNDVGAAYAVYLKDPPESSYYQNIPVISVASGFIGKGDFATESRDFTAPEGYQQLCVSINGKEECGFKQVTSSFALDYVRDKFTSDEIKRERITSEKECIAGGTNWAAALQLNPEAAGQELLLPENYNRGVNRICSTQNPGLGIDITRFEEVGYCDDAKIKCWLDKNSIKDALSSNVPADAGVKGDTLKEIEARQIEKLNKERIASGEARIISDGATFKTEIDGIVKERNSLFKDGVTADNVDAVAVKFETFLDRLFFNHHKARTLLEKGSLFDSYARKLVGAKGGVVVMKEKTAEEAETAEAEETPAENGAEKAVKAEESKTEEVSVETGGDGDRPFTYAFAQKNGKGMPFTLINVEGWILDIGKYPSLLIIQSNCESVEMRYEKDNLLSWILFEKRKKLNSDKNNLNGLLEVGDYRYINLVCINDGKVVNEQNLGKVEVIKTSVADKIESAD